MYNKILLIIILIIVSCLLISKINNFSKAKKENFKEAPPYVQRKGMLSTTKVIPLNKLTTVKEDKLLKASIQDRVSDLAVQDYNQILVDDTKDLTYYQNDIINQGNIYENAYDIENQIDLVDYSDVTTGMEKCQKSCSGTCFELGYTGTATCFPKTKPFDWGTLYKNPMFTYGDDGNHFNSLNYNYKN
jgi:hypothetical protein